MRGLIGIRAMDVVQPTRVLSLWITSVIFSASASIGEGISGTNTVHMPEVWGDASVLRQLYATNAMAFNHRVGEIVATHSLNASGDETKAERLASAELSLLAYVTTETGTHIGKYPEYNQPILANMAMECILQICSSENMEAFLCYAVILKAIRKQIIPGYVIMAFLYSSPATNDGLMQRVNECNEQTNFQLEIRRIERKMLFSLFSCADQVFSKLDYGERSEVLLEIAKHAELSERETSAFLRFHETRNLPEEDDARKMREPTEGEVRAFFDSAM